MYDEIPTDFDLSMEDDMIMDEINFQLECKIPVYQNKKNFLEILYTKYKALNSARITSDDEDEPDAIEVNDAKLDEYYSEVVGKMQGIVGILIDRSSKDINYAIINSIYENYVIDIHQNMVDFITRSININKQTFASVFTEDRLVNLTVKMARRHFKSKTDATIAIHLTDIISNILQDNEIMNPENMMNILYQLNPDKYLYSMCMNLYRIGYLGFDVPTYLTHIRTIYQDPMNFEQLKVDVTNQLLPTFPCKDISEENDEITNDQINDAANASI